MIAPHVGRHAVLVAQAENLCYLAHVNKIVKIYLSPHRDESLYALTFVIKPDIVNIYRQSVVPAVREHPGTWPEPLLEVPT